MPNPNPSKFTMWDTTTGQKDLDDEFITDDWLEEQFVGENLYAWGQDNWGQLGNGNNGTSTSSPAQIGSIPTWRQIACGYKWSAMIKNDGTLWCCGYNATQGQLGQNNTTNQSSPVQVGALTNWKQISCAGAFFGAVKTDGTLWTCGYNTNGQLGNGTVTSYSSPIQVGTLTNWKQVACGYRFWVAIKQDGTLWSCGYNTQGQLGNSTTTKYSSPIQVGALTTWKCVSASNKSWSGITTDGKLWTCGYGGLYELGNGSTTNVSTPIQIGTLTNWKQVGNNYGHVHAIKTDGTLWGWGHNQQGQIGNGTSTAYISTPVQVGTLTNWKQVAVGDSDNVSGAAGANSVSAAVKTDGTLWTWGGNASGQLGNGTTTSYSSPIQVGSLTNWKQVAAGYGFVLAINYAEIT